MDKASQILGVTREIVSLDNSADSFLGQDPFPIHALGSGKGPWQYSSKLVPWLIGNMDRFDVIIVNGIWLYHSYAVWKAIHQIKKSGQGQAKLPKIFIMPHGMLDPWFQDVKGREWKAWRNWIYWKLIENKVINDADGLLFTCQTELLLARKPFKPYHPKKEINVGYGVNEPPPFSDSMREAFENKCPEIGDQPYMLFLSRIHYKKGVDLLIKAYELLLQSTSGIPKLVIAGPGLDTPYGQTLLQQIATNSQLKDSVFFTGMLTGDAKWGAINGCEAFILPSHQENFGIAVVEAMSCGKPVLISNQVNIWSEIEAGGGGLIAGNSLEGITQLLKSWLNLSVSQQRLMGQKAKATFEKYFNITQVSIRMSKILN
ncbi:hypothetical protein GCM10027190_32710 [Spirosoma areae]